MPYSSEQLIIFFAFLPVLLASVIGAIRLKKLSETLKILTYLIFFALIVESVSRILWLYKISNLFLWPVYVTVEFGFLIWIYSIELKSNLLIKARVWLIAVFGVYLTYKTLQISSRINLIDNSGRLVESICLIVIILFHYYKIYKEQPMANLWSIPMFCVSTGLLIFFSGNFFIFLFINFILQYSQKLNYQIWLIHAFLNCILYLIYSFVLWRRQEN
ncbi:hypothetical protein SAMN04487995_0032 [Dyadobacter koreensis]|uniref:Uncharacterized protein n=1 Tax=Dyadobacter koreensis TaxID=408657 RepID=A0A1H6QA98_9BACT|nr:hypothetical protein [Dyadobacter koreensis]SEI37077.1 hypothetical protein SAMN04487995_0032 [Dyadobacter koreensis]